MINFKKYFLFLQIFIFIASCSGFSDFKKTMTGEKITSTDEFLIKKKDPLILPPEFEKLPLPKNGNKKAKTNSVETVLGSYNKSDQETKTSSNLEKMILKELNK